MKLVKHQYGNHLVKSLKAYHYPVLLALAILCFIPTLFYYYVGEEAVFTLNSIEMWQHQEFRSVIMYGSVGGRPPLFNWLMIPLTALMGWEHVLIASRIVTVAATVGTGLILAWLAQQLWRNPTVSWVAATLYLVTADVALYRGWLSYADPLFSMWIVFSIALIWVACLRLSLILISAAMVAAFAAFLTKAFTAYVFLGVSGLILLTHPDYRRFLLGYRALMAFGVGFLLPVIWLAFGTHDAGQGGGMYHDMADKLVGLDLGKYGLRLLAYPSEIFLRMMPASLFLAYFLIYKRGVIHGNAAVKTALFIAGVNFLLYLLAPYGGARYVMPIYAFVVLAAAYLVVQHTSPFPIKKWIVGVLVIELLLRVFAFPYYQKAFRGENFKKMAEVIVAQYGQHPIYITSTDYIGISVAAYIDTLRPRQPAITFPPADLKDGIVITRPPQTFDGRLLDTITQDGYSVYLVCRGIACDGKLHD